MEGVYSHPVGCLKGALALQWCLEHVLGLSEGFYEGSNQVSPVLTRHPPDTLQKHSRNPARKASKTPSIHLPYTLPALARHPSNTISTPLLTIFKHTLDNRQVIQRLQNEFLSLVDVWVVGDPVIIVPLCGPTCILQDFKQS